MYDELAKRLRTTRVTVFKAEDVSLLAEAADAIEWLSMRLHGDEAAIAGMQREIERMVVAGKPNWIPVTEQLIHSGWYLVACNEWGDSAVRKAIYDEATREWLEFPCRGPKDITKFVTHYTPLPDPPKEE